MIVEGTFTFQGPRETVWELLQNPDVLVKVLPGAKRLVRAGEDRFDGVMQVGVGPVTAAEFTVSVMLKDKVPPQYYAMEVDSKGTLGFTRGSARVALEVLADGGTLMKYTAELQVGGKIAGVGQRLLDQVAKLMTRQGLEALNKELRARLAGGSSR
ncbi:MAG TPA: carbon monoxide dehydrogenase subunit G [Gemmatimonadales bacterium]|nr:carbon monoxide dehydrogenase subunit G [Gemmatimonadales bacterium]